MLNIMQRTSSLAVLGGLILATAGTGTASASSEAGNWGFTRIYAKGTYFAVMTDSSSTFCFLTEMKVEETDSAGEYAHCKISAQNGRWVLETTLGKDSDATVACAARCYTNK